MFKTDVQSPKKQFIKIKAEAIRKYKIVNWTSAKSGLHQLQNKDKAYEGSKKMTIKCDSS